MKIPNNGKIFQIGKHKCGTTSLYNFFKGNGVSSVHWDYGHLAKKIYENQKNGVPLLTGYERYTFFSDMQCGLETELDGNFYAYKMFKELDKQYPNSKFILNVRDVNKYLNSKVNHFFGEGNTLQYTQKITGLSNKNIVRLWLEEYYQHYIDVLMYFKDRPNDLLVFDIEKDKISKIIDFFPYMTLNATYYQVKNKNTTKKFNYETFTVKSKLEKGALKKKKREVHRVVKKISQP